jgi:hypothetical protein
MSCFFMKLLSDVWILQLVVPDVHNFELVFCLVLATVVGLFNMVNMKTREDLNKFRMYEYLSQLGLLCA